MNPLSRLVVSAIAAIAVGVTPAFAQYPDRPIKIVVGFAPGGFTDVLARVIGQKLNDRLGKPVIVENKAGATGTIGADSVAKAPADGYTLLLGHVNSNSIAPALYPQLPYDVIKDFTPIIHIASTPMVLTVNAGVAAKDVKELIALAKVGNGLTFASSGVGSVQHLAAELFMKETGTRMTHVPYRGSGAAITDLVSGQVNLNFESPPNILSLVASGKLRALAVTSTERLPSMKDVPTLSEAGVKGAEISQWFGLFGPANMPKDLVARLNSEIAAILQSPEVVERIRSQEGTILGGSPDAFAAFLRDDTTNWAKLIKEANITLN
jgi:tripartite-type tricarboxylate transporter receptor subunit TctC